MNTVTSKDGTTIAYDQYGKGPALILVGGATAYRAIDPKMAQLAGLLSAHFTVIHYDRRGRGDSGDTPPHAAEREYEDLDALIKAAGGTASLFGISSGAVLALRAAAAHLSIRKLAAYEPPFVVDAGRAPLPADYIAHQDELLAAGRLGDMVAYFMIHAAGMPAETVEPMRDQPFWPALEASARSLPYDARQMGDTMSGKPLAAQPWRSISIPTIVIDGGASPEWMHKGAQAVADIVPNSQRRTLEGQTHDVDMEVLAPVLDEFFSS